ncbi:RNA polymerase II transcription factor B subunit 4 [Arachnomyces sp. PD_36]|nr:RNA polymerase II transcription factor B subunit 4 [Arachnomyces sp. PD_36]
MVKPASSLLTIILDTNPHAWAKLEDTLPLSTAVANLLVFINAHLACNYTNKVAVVASHVQQARWLYPTNTKTQESKPEDEDGDTNMGEEDIQSSTRQTNRYLPFLKVEEQLTQNLKDLFTTTDSSTVTPTSSTMMAGALTLALSHINRETIAYSETHGNSSSTFENTTSSTTNPTSKQSSSASTGLQSRILIISVSSSTGSAHQYIPIMNCIFACQRLHIPIDVCKLSGDAVFLQQASDATKGIYMPLSEPRGLLQYLMMAFLPDQRSRKHLILPTRIDVDFRAACFCHRKVVDIGFVCSICLSIFCEPPENGDCLTCGNHLQLGDYGAKPVVVVRKKKKQKNRMNGKSGTSTPTPAPTPTPGPS